MHFRTTTIFALSWATVLALPRSTDLDDVDEVFEKRASLPFKQIVAFGDDFTDDGSGDPVTGEGKHLWGADTWTDGFIPVTYMAKKLGIPIKNNYAFGSAGGAQFVGSVCDNSLIPSNQVDTHAKLLNGQLVPDALSQVRNYTSGPLKNDIANTLHFFWTGNNDMIASLGWIGRFTICEKDTLCHPGQQQFITSLTNCARTGLQNLINAGAKHILVPNVYPRNLAPWTSQYISSSPGMIADFGNVIAQYNDQLQALVKNLRTQHKVKITYFDMNKLMTKALNDPSLVQNARYGYTCIDGCVKQIPGPLSNWETFWQNTVLGKKPNDFYWMTTVMPSSTVCKKLGNKLATLLLKRK